MTDKYFLVESCLNTGNPVKNLPPDHWANMIHNLEKRTGTSIDDLTANFDSDQLAMGIEIEKEHTSNEDIAKKIAIDHLKEIPDYYTRLKRMEADAEAGKTESAESNDFYSSHDEVL